MIKLPELFQYRSGEFGSLFDVGVVLFRFGHVFNPFAKNLTNRCRAKQFAVFGEEELEDG